VLVGIAAGSEALKARGEVKNSDENPPESRAPGALNIGDNTMIHDSVIAGRDIDQSMSLNVNRSRTTVIRGFGGITGLLAFLALGGAVGGTAFISQQPNTISLESPQTLIPQGSNASPRAAIDGFFGDLLVGDVAGACGYVVPDLQQNCSTNYINNPSDLPTPPAGDSVYLGTGTPIVNGPLALVPIIGKECNSKTCQTSGTNGGLPAGMSFQDAFQQSVQNFRTGNIKPLPNGVFFLPVEEVGTNWYITI
jgi:hypothetical protein